MRVIALLSGSKLFFWGTIGELSAELVVWPRHLGAWRNGRRRGLKNLSRKACGFESHRPYQILVSQKFQMPGDGCRSRGLEPARARASSKREAFVASGRAARRAAKPSGRAAAGESHRPYQILVSQKFQMPGDGCRSRGLEPARARASSKREAFVASGRAARRAAKPSGRAAAGESHRPYQSKSCSSA